MSECDVFYTVALAIILTKLYLLVLYGVLFNTCLLCMHLFSLSSWIMICDFAFRRFMTFILGKIAIVKEQFSKKYRHLSLDFKLTLKHLHAVSLFNYISKFNTVLLLTSYFQVFIWSTVTIMNNLSNCDVVVRINILIINPVRSVIDFIELFFVFMFLKL